MSVVGQPANLRFAVLLAGLALAGTACIASVDEVQVDPVQAPALGRPQPAVEPAIEPVTDEQPDQAQAGDGEAIRDVPNPELVEPRPIPWDRVSFDRGAQTLDVWWWSSGGCTGLSRVLVDFFEDEVEVTVLEGQFPDGSFMTCAADPVYFTHTVELAEDPGSRTFVDGAR